jgi:cytochrome c oxidase subunit 2
MAHGRSVRLSAGACDLFSWAGRVTGAGGSDKSRGESQRLKDEGAMRLGSSAIAALAALGWTAARAQDHQPVEWGLGLLPARSALAEEVHFFHNGVLMPIITVISLVVLLLLVWVIFRYNAKANPTPKKFSHNTLVEVIWTAIPILILVTIFIPSVDLLFKEDRVPDGKQVVAQGDGSTREFAFRNDFSERRLLTRRDHLRVWLDEGGGARELGREEYDVRGLGDETVRVALKEPPASGTRVVIRGGRTDEPTADCNGWPKVLGFCRGDIALAPTMTLKVVGFQWGWTYFYPDFGDFEFNALMVPREQTTHELYHFDADNEVVVPVGETIRVTATARDVIHAWALPNFAIKIDAVPGRVNEVWFRAQREGVYFGQCSELCGIRHAFMPIEVRAVSRPEFEAWVDSQRALAGLEPMFGDGKPQLAQAAAEEAK